MAAPFQSRALPEQGFFGRIFGRIHREALIADVETALADAADWASVTRSDVAALEQKYGGTLKDNALNEAVMLLCRAADDMAPSAIVEGGAGRLRQLAAALDIARPAETVVQSKVRSALEDAAQRLISDGELTPDERVHFADAAERCGMDEAAAQDILSAAVAARMKAEITEAMADDRLTDTEEARIDALGHALHAKLDLDDTTRDALARAKRLWQVEEGPLQAVTCPIDLPRTEICLYAGYGQAMEPRTRGARSFTHSYGAGDIVLTNKRILFNGGERNLAVRLNLIVDYHIYDDGIEVRRASGKPLTFALNTKDEWFARLFARARREAA